MQILISPMYDIVVLEFLSVKFAAFMNELLNCVATQRGKKKDAWTAWMLPYLKTTVFAIPLFHKCTCEIPRCVVAVDN